MKLYLRPDIGYTNLPFEAKALEVKYVVRMRQKQHETRKQTSVGK